MDLQGKTVLIVGAGKSGIAAGELLKKRELHTGFMMEIKNCPKRNCKKMTSGKIAGLS